MKGNIIISVLPIGNLLSQAQSSYFGFKGGLNRSVLAGTVNISPYYKSGLVLGIYIDRAVTKKFHIQPELVFSRQGARVEYNSSPCSSAVVGETKTSLVYLDLLAKVYVDKVVDPQAVGPGLVLAVNPGDKITMKTYARYLEDPGNTDVVGDLALAVASAFGYDPVDPETQPVYDLFSGAFSGGPLFDGDANGAPKAYLNYIYFDKNFMVEDFGYQQVSTAAQNSWELLDLDIDAKVPGYVYIYVANESTANVNTFFDNIEITLEESPMAGGNDYYPFGRIDFTKKLPQAKK